MNFESPAYQKYWKCLLDCQWHNKKEIFHLVHNLPYIGYNFVLPAYAFFKKLYVKGVCQSLEVMIFQGLYNLPQPLQPQYGQALRVDYSCKRVA